MSRTVFTYPAHSYYSEEEYISKIHRGLKFRILIFIFVLVISGCDITQPKAGDIFTASEDGMELAFVPAGYYEMGSAANAAQVDDDEIPMHRIYTDSFWMDRTEVTNAMYQRCISAVICTSPAQSKSYLNPRYVDHPILGVSWNQAKAYCEWANRRLPTEAEWEKAARGTDGRIYPWGEGSPTNELLNFDHISNGTTPVGMYPKGASPYGIFDMAGNVWEWVQDGYTPGFYSISPEKNPVSISPVNLRVLRGGNWDSNADGVRATNRFWAFPGRNDTDGFRCAKSD